MSKNNPKQDIPWIVGPNNRLSYPVKSGGNEYYPKIDNEDVILESSGVMRYAKTVNGEVYPKDLDGNDKFIPSRYAIDKNGEPFFPKDKQLNEFYVEDGYGNSVIQVKGKPLEQYAKGQKSEIYPKEFIDEGMYRDVVLNNKYAVKTTGEKFYPLDEFGNEYTIEIIDSATDKMKLAESFPNGYPITNDQYVILTNVSGEPTYLAHPEPTVEEVNISGRIFRSAKGYSDYFTDVQHPTKKTRSSLKKYKYLCEGALEPETWIPASLISEQTTSNWCWIFIILFSLLGILTIPFVFAYFQKRK